MAKKKSFSVSVDPESVMYTNLSKSKEYNSARLVAKIGDNEYMSISYEWEGDYVPDFAMNLMDFMKANNVETSGVWPEFVGTEDAAKKCGNGKPAGMKKKKKAEEDEEEKETSQKKEKICPDCKKPMSKCTCEDEDEEDMDE